MINDAVITEKGNQRPLSANAMRQEEKWGNKNVKLGILNRDGNIGNYKISDLYI